MLLNLLLLTTAKGEWCSGVRRSRDAIVWLGQRKHSSYDATHRNTLNASMASVARFYAKVRDADVLVWHEGDLTRADADALEGATTVRFCLLGAKTGWGKPAAQQGVQLVRKNRWSLGYLSMIRWYAVTCWDVLHALGYSWVMRFDDDSFLLSPVPYNVFEAMRTTSKVYGFRTLARECDRNFGAFVDEYVARHDVLAEQLLDDGTIFCEKFPKRCADGKPPTIRRTRYCEGPGRLGFYNNWFVTDVEFWRSPNASSFRRAFDDSALIFSHRCNDLIFQTALVRLLLPRAQWRRFADFSYLHHTVRDGAVRWGGLETGYDDPAADTTIAAYLAEWGDSEARECQVQLTLEDASLRRVAYVPHGQTRFRGAPPAAPFCNLRGVAPLW